MTLLHNISRQSNMELLRVISMILILMIHADFSIIGTKALTTHSISITTWFLQAYIHWYS